MAGSAVGVVGTAPISFTDSTGAQRSVPLSALQFSGSTLELAGGWDSTFIGTDKDLLLAVAKARAIAGELTAPPIRPPSPASAVTATHPGPESNNISVAVTVTADHDHPHDPLSATLQFSATETDTYAGLRTATEAAMKIGVDTPSDQQGWSARTGLVVVKSSSVATVDNLPVEHPQSALPPAGLDVQAADHSTLFTLVPRADYSGSGELSVGVALDPTGATFTVTATYSYGSPEAVSRNRSGRGGLPMTTRRQRSGVLDSMRLPHGGVVAPWGRGVVFLATPHDGASVARIAEAIVSTLQRG